MMPYKLAIFWQAASLTGKKRFLTRIRYRIFSGKGGERQIHLKKESEQGSFAC
jgi:hypothetical protein